MRNFMQEQYAKALEIINQQREEIERLKAAAPPVPQEGLDLTKEILGLKCVHVEVEDTWYSCPKSPEGCGDENAGSDCTCGADFHNAKVDALIARLQPPQGQAPSPGAAHPDELAVDAFSVAMKDKLAKKRAQGYGGWSNPDECSLERLASLLVSHLSKGDPVDIGNFAMMLHQRGAPREILSQAAPAPVESPAVREAVRSRDALFCRALKSALGPRDIERVTATFNALRPNPAPTLNKESQ